MAAPRHPSHTIAPNQNHHNPNPIQSHPPPPPPHHRTHSASQHHSPIYAARPPPTPQQQQQQQQDRERERERERMHPSHHAHHLHPAHHPSMSAPPPSHHGPPGPGGPSGPVPIPPPLPLGVQPSPPNPPPSAGGAQQQQHHAHSLPVPVPIPPPGMHDPRELRERERDGRDPRDLMLQQQQQQQQQGGMGRREPGRALDLMEQFKNEMEQLNAEAAQYRAEREEFESRIRSQTAELSEMRHLYHILEQKQLSLRETYDTELSAVRADNVALRQHMSQLQAQLERMAPPGPPAQPPSAGPPGSAGGYGPQGAEHYRGPPPPQQGQGHGPPPPGLAPAPPGGREREREREMADRRERERRDRERDERERDRERERLKEREEYQARERARERELRDRELRERDGRERELRERDMRERERQEAREREMRERERQDRMDVDVKPFYGPPVPPPSLPPANGQMHMDRHPDDERAAMQRDRERELMERSRPGAGHPGPEMPMPPQHRDRERERESAPAPPQRAMGPVPPPMPLPLPARDRDVEMRDAPHPLPPAPLPAPPQAAAAAGVAVNPAPPSSSSRADRPSQTGTLVIQQNIVRPGEEQRGQEVVDMDRVGPEYRTEGGDWFAIYNPHVVPRVLDVKLVHTLLHESVVCCVRFSSDGTRLATGCNRSAQIFNTKTGEKIMALIDETANKNGDLYIRSVCFSPDGRLLATGAEDRQIRIWDLVRKTVLYIFEGHQQEIYSLCFSPDGRYIVSGSGDKTACVWELGESRLPPLPAGHESAPPQGMCAARVFSIVDQVLPPSPDAEGRTPATQQDAGVTSVAVSPDGRFVACGSLDCVVRIWDVQSGQMIERLRGHRDSVYSVAFSPDGKALVSGSLDKTLKWWNLSDLKNLDGDAQRARRGRIMERRETMTFGGHKDYVLSVAMSPDGKWIVSGSKDRGVQFWDPRTATTQFVLQGHKNSVISIDMSGGQGPPGSGLLATGSGDYQARIWSYGPYHGPGGLPEGARI